MGRCSKQFPPELLPLHYRPGTGGRAREFAFGRFLSCGPPHHRPLDLQLYVWIEYAIAARIALARHDIVIYDRYLPDAELDLDLNFPDQERIAAVGISLVRATMRSPEHMLLLQLPLSLSEARRCSKDEPFPETEQQSRARFECYDPAQSRWRSAIIIDAAQSESQVAADVAAVVGLKARQESDG